MRCGLTVGNILSGVLSTVIDVESDDVDCPRGNQHLMIMLKVSVRYGLLHCLWFRLRTRLERAFSKILHEGGE